MKPITRRGLLKSSATAGGLSILAIDANADVPAGRDPFDYEINRSEAEWRALLSDGDYSILREGSTEIPKSSPLWNETREGQYNCKGCDLPQYSSATKVVLDKGWLFFTASEPNSQLMSQDIQGEMAEAVDLDPFDVLIEAHCRRCGSHIGHILPVIGKALHCVNGASLNFEEIST
ncbi:peptide-methionine (R)-S-oxide reductase [Yoonia sp. BS5-3]|uniref:peptide-methionine (R)-S-oxide reductase n=1 Tax=Yoonia phaeophyticola TaxID=3137369 RepID=A0ABZ2V887_9RHOB